MHYRKVIAVVAALAGVPETRLETQGVQLVTADSGSQAVVNVRNAGNVLIKAKGTLEIGGSQGRSAALPFAVDTLLPGADTAATIDLSQVKLQPGSYDVRVQLEPQRVSAAVRSAGAAAPEADAGTAAAASETRPAAVVWQGSVTTRAPAVEPAAAPAPPIALGPLEPLPTPLQPLTAAVPQLPTGWIMAGLLLLVVLLFGSILGWRLSRREARASVRR